jgi:hypothetical protein
MALTTETRAARRAGRTAAASAAKAPIATNRPISANGIEITPWPPLDFTNARRGCARKCGCARGMTPVSDAAP